MRAGGRRARGAHRRLRRGRAARRRARRRDRLAGPGGGADRGRHGAGGQGTRRPGPPRGRRRGLPRLGRRSSSWDRSVARMAALVGAAAQNGTSRADRRGAWIVPGWWTSPRDPCSTGCSAQRRRDADPARHRSGAPARPRRGPRRDRGARAAAGRAAPGRARAWTSGSGSGSGWSRSACCWRCSRSSPPRAGSSPTPSSTWPSTRPAFLARALSLWDPQQFGQLQDQAVGYLFPMGPFFYLGKLAAPAALGHPAAVDQRGRRDRVPRHGPARGPPGHRHAWTRVAAGCAYALSPAGLTLIGGLSAEFLPAAMLPWILIPLVDATRGGRPGRSPPPAPPPPSACAAGSTRPRPSRC